MSSICISWPEWRVINYEEHYRKNKSSHPIYVHTIRGTELGKKGKLSNRANERLQTATHPSRRKYIIFI